MIAAQPLPRQVHQFVSTDRPLGATNHNQYMGRYAEELAVGLYRMAKFEILGCDVRINKTQIDFIARRDTIIHFVEVKYRRSIIEGHRAITHAQLGRLVGAVAHFARTNRGTDIQLDYVLFDRDYNWQRIDNIDATSHIVC